MTIYTCKCLNIKLRVTGEIPLRQAARVADTEQRDAFFRETLVSAPSAELIQEVAQQALVSLRRSGAWTVHVCLACDTHTHATGPDTHTLLNKATETTPEAVEALKTSTHFSPVFKLLVPEISSEDSKENAERSKVPCLIPTVPALSKQLSSSLQSQIESIEESVRLFRDQKYAEYEEFRERANRDHQILASIVSKARQAEGPHGAPVSPPTPLELRRRLSSFKGIKKLKQNTIKNTRNMGSEEDSLDVEDIFDLEGDTHSRNGNNSDADDYDSEDSGSNDEGIHVRGPASGRAAQLDTMARSLPVNMPKFSYMPMSRQQPDDEEEPQDIAASIKALARSVHADVFGDLPRPRFSTQI